MEIVRCNPGRSLLASFKLYAAVFVPECLGGPGYDEPSRLFSGTITCGFLCARSTSVCSHLFSLMFLHFSSHMARYFPCAQQVCSCACFLSGSRDFLCPCSGFQLPLTPCTWHWALHEVCKLEHELSESPTPFRRSTYALLISPPLLEHGHCSLSRNPCGNSSIISQRV